MAQQWYWAQGKQINGPIEAAGLKDLAQSGQLKSTDMIWREGLPNWLRASQAKGLFPDQVSGASGLPVNQAMGTIFNAISDNDVVTVQSLLDSMPELVTARFDQVRWNDERDKYDGDMWDATPLHWAAVRGFPCVAEVLLDRGAAVDTRDRDGCTPLHQLGAMANDDQADDDGSYRTAEMLLAHGAAINAKDNSGNTPLHNAASRPKLWRTVDLLISHGANVNARENAGLTPLHNAALYDGSGRPEGVIRILVSLLEAGMDINAVTVAGETQTPLNWALQRVEKWRGLPDFQQTYVAALAIADFLEAHGASDGYGENRIDKTAMTCSDHPGARVVAICSNGCGRVLCVNCANEYRPPTCKTCAQTYFGMK